MVITNTIGNGEKKEMQQKNNKSIKEIKALVKRTNKENVSKADIKALKKEFENTPRLYRNIGNINHNLFSTILDNAISNSVLIRECTEKFIEEMKVELGFENSTFVEKMLIDEIVMRWLRLQTIENQHHSKTNESHTLAAGIYFDKRLSVAQNQFLRSIESLAKVRKMIAQTQAKGAKMFKDLMSEKEK